MAQPRIAGIPICFILLFFFGDMSQNAGSSANCVVTGNFLYNLDVNHFLLKDKKNGFIITVDGIIRRLACCDQSSLVTPSCDLLTHYRKTSRCPDCGSRSRHIHSYN